MPEVSKDTLARSLPGSKRLAWGLAWGVGLVLIGLFSWDHVQLLEADYLVCSPNTFRDFEVYREIAEGEIFLQGPSTSIGGNHGYLAYHVFGLVLAVFSGFSGLQAAGVLILLASMGLSWAIARRVGSAAHATLATGVFLASQIASLIHYPNHIALIPLGTAMALYGLLRAREGTRWALLAICGVVLAIGSHRTGWILLVSMGVMNLVFRRGLLRKPMVLLPLAAYVLPTVVLWLMGMGSTSSAAELGQAFADFEPWLVVQTMPFHAFMEDAGSGPRGVEVALVLAALGVARWRLVDDDQKMLWWFYAANFAFYPFYKYDPQYYMPMFVVLPALLTMAMTRMERFRRGGGLLAMVVVAGVLLQSAWALHVQTRGQLHPDSKHFRSIASELAVVDALSELGISPKELLERTYFGAKSDDTRIAYLFKAFGRFGEGAEGRCIRIERAAEPASSAVHASMDAGAYRIDLLPRDGAPCDANVTPVREEFVRWDLKTWELVRR